MSTRLLILFALIICFGSIRAQFSYVYDSSIPVLDEEGGALDLAWTGGINGAQFNTIDLDGDGQEDLVLFERTANKVMTFLTRNKRYEYAPAYESYFPTGVSNWILLKDFNCDNKKDIFTGDILGMKVFENVSVPGEPLKWKQFMFYGPGNRSEVVLTKGFTQKINLQLQFDDLPTLFDADQDGDLDIYKVTYTGNGSVEYHKNFSMERYGRCDSLDFERQTQAWGNFTQCQCEDFAFDGAECFTGGRVQHAGGKALLAIDLDNDNDNELIFSEASCQKLFLMSNQGDNQNPIITEALTFPEQPVDMATFPAAFFEDVDFDGHKDLIASPNIYRKEFLDMDLKASTWLYKNVGTSVLPQFTFVKNDFLQDEMIDVGDNAVPAFEDEDGDGDLDLFIGYNSDASTFGSISFFRNMGTSTAPSFQYITHDFSGIKALKLYNIKPQIVDINGDGKADLVFSATNAAGKTALYYLPNTKDKGMQYDLAGLKTIAVSLTSQENFHVAQINSDGKPDLLVGRFSGALEYWENIGAPSLPQFYLQNPRFLNLENSVSRLGMACFSGDLNADGKQDLVITNVDGKLGIISDFLKASDLSEEQNAILFSPLVNQYEPVMLGRTWPTVAKLFNTKRPAIIAGTIRGGLQILRNEEKDPQFEELSLEVYPNPTSKDGTVQIETNMPLTLQIHSALGQEISSAIQLFDKVNTVRLPNLAAGIYIFKFTSGGKSIHRRILVQ